MSRYDNPKLAEIAQYIASVREDLGDQGTFRLRILLEMIILELSDASAEHPAVLRPDTPDEP